MIYPTSPFEREVEKAIDRTNQEFLSDPEAMNRATADGERWRRQLEAKGILPPVEGPMKVSIWQVDREAAIVQAMEILDEQSTEKALTWRVSRVAGRRLRTKGKTYSLYEIQIPG